MSDTATEPSPVWLPRPQTLAYVALAIEGAGESLQRSRAISESDLRQRLAEGDRISRVVVVEVNATADYLAYLRLAGTSRAGYLLLVMRRYEGARAWSDFRTLRRAFAGWGYPGPLMVYPEGHPRLACLGIGVD
ncbi:hypothetical protein [Roseomonas sp. KE2513]|uniref:hypothetical protein n=1 Tax=Roseomonas sp. KE2513 TaxID=2479202 RepID=UPI0018DF55C6|nr:hypothetical protein [Roseomonas sp. KE2513]